MVTTLNPEYERELIDIVRALPPDRAEQLVDFARFLEARILYDDLALDSESDDIEAENAQWNALLESDEGQNLLEKLAREALAEYRAGQTKPMNFDDEGRIVPE